jgi:hypothetical protein
MRYVLWLFNVALDQNEPRYFSYFAVPICCHHHLVVVLNFSQRFPLQVLQRIRYTCSSAPVVLHPQLAIEIKIFRGKVNSKTRLTLMFLTYFYLSLINCTDSYWRFCFVSMFSHCCYKARPPRNPETLMLRSQKVGLGVFLQQLAVLDQWGRSVSATFIHTGKFEVCWLLFHFSSSPGSAAQCLIFF